MSLPNKNQRCSMPYACSREKNRISNMCRKIINNVNGNMNIHIHTCIHIHWYPPPTWLCCSKMMLERHTWRAEKWWRPVLTLIILVMCRPAHSALMIVDGFFDMSPPQTPNKIADRKTNNKWDDQPLCYFLSTLASCCSQKVLEPIL